MQSYRWTNRQCALAALACASIAALCACSLDKQSIPPFEGPATYGLNLVMTVHPDVLTADGFSTAEVIMTLRNTEGDGISGRQLTVDVADQDGNRVEVFNFNPVIT